MKRRDVLKIPVAVAAGGALVPRSAAAATTSGGAAAGPAAPAVRPAGAWRVPAWRTGPGDWGDQGDGTYRNPVLNGDWSDPDVIRAGADFYLVSSEFHFMGMTVLHSADLVNWRYLGRVYDRLDISPYYDTPLPATDPNTRYSKGSWAPALRYRAGKFWIYFCTPTEGCFMTTATNPAGPWAPLTAVHLYASGEHPWEDPCPLWDDDGSAYLGHSLKGSGPIIIHRMSPDGTTLLDDGTLVYSGPNAEGTKLYKRNGFYYLIIPQNGFTVGDQWVLRASSIYGPYASEAGKPVLQIGNGVIGPHQGGLVDTPGGQWWFMHFEENGAIGRVVWLEPARWTSDGWLRMGVDSAGDGVGQPVINYPKPDAGPEGNPVTAPASSDDFTSRELSLQSEWNHNPVDGHWSLSARPGYLRLIPVGAVSDAFLASNTLTQKLLGRIGVVTTELDTSGMVDGQNAGLLHMSASAQWVGIERSGGVSRVKAVVGGATSYGPEMDQHTIWLRSDINLDQETTLSYSTDGIGFTQIGGPLTLTFANWKGDKFGLFSYNTLGSGGAADFGWLTYSHDGPGGGYPRTDIAPAYSYPGPATFNGTNYVDAGTNPYLQTSEITVSFTMTAAQAADMVPLDKLPATTDGRAGGYSVALRADGSLDWITGAATLHVPGAYTAGRAVEVTCTLSVDATGYPEAAVYLDGVRRARSAVPGSSTVMNTTTRLRLGVPSKVSTSSGYAGTLSGVRIWTRALSSGDVRSVLADTTPPVLRVRDVIARRGDRVDLGTAFVSDDSPVVVTTNAPPVFFTYPVGTSEVTWTATDAAGNATSEVQHVTVLP